MSCIAFISISLSFIIPVFAKVANPVFYSQYGQDRLLNQKIFKNKRNGFFIEVGAYDGIKYSNTKFYEDHLQWKGICVEPIPEYFQQLRRNRPSSICILGCIANQNGTAFFHRIKSKQFCVEMLSGILDKYDPKHLARAKREMKNSNATSEIIPVNCYLLNDILNQHGIDSVDYLSIDTEGGELEILQSIDFERFNIEVIEVENNYRIPDIKEFMTGKGYRLFDDAYDEIYIKSSSKGR